MPISLHFNPSNLDKSPHLDSYICLKCSELIFEIFHEYTHGFIPLSSIFTTNYIYITSLVFNIVPFPSEILNSNISFSFEYFPFQKLFKYMFSLDVFFENLLFKFSNQINSNPQRSWFIDIRLYYMKWTICIYINIIIYPKLCKSTRVLAEWGEVPGFLLATTFQSSQTSGVMWSLKYQQSFAALMIPRAANQPQLRRRTLLGSCLCWKH